MKRIVHLLILLVPVFSFAQEESKEKHIEVVNTIQKEYNAKNYKAIYEILDKEFRSAIKEKELADFFTFNVYDFYGPIVKTQYTGTKRSPMHSFLVECKKGLLDLDISCTAEGKITGMQWLPHREGVAEPITTKNFDYASDNPKANPLDLKVDSIVKNYISDGANCGLSVAICNKGQVRYYNYGEIKRSAKQLPDKKTIYEIGSVSKVFTGILLARAVKDNKVSLNDDIRKYLPGEYKNLVFRGRPIELVHLASHTSRIPRLPDDLDKTPGFDALNPYKHYNKDLMFDYLHRVVIDTLPGMKSEYSNLGMALLGVILEKVYNKTYEDLVVEYISEPLGLTGTKINLSEEEKSRFAQGYAMEGNETPHWELGDFAGAGGIRSTPEDMMNFVIANMEEKNEALKLSHSSTFNDGRNHTALGWQIITKKGNEMIWHNGGTFGFSAFASFIRSKDIGVVVLSNSGNSVDPIALGILKYLQ